MTDVGGWRSLLGWVRVESHAKNRLLAGPESKALGRQDHLKAAGLTSEFDSLLGTRLSVCCVVLW